MASRPERPQGVAPQPQQPPPGRVRLPRALRRELIIYGAALVFGLLLVPLAIWFGGNRVLGPYSHGQNAHAGPLALLADFFVGLWHGSAVFWAVALGPAVLLSLLRLLVRLVRLLPPARRPEAPPSPPPRRVREHHLGQ